ncbi:mobility group protein 1B isoform X2 [Drosophila biarmipes]|uniref:mobility group protein 1B isoform X2 n=1 Tax=Drosophila biarmipes TaxID=125945 RepID=UPI0007E705B8|nr:mobility group protein 1B isoform X2 [Drosophila biarmipes]
MSSCGARPKRPLTAYLLWLNSYGRELIKSEHPEFKVKEVAVRAGELWRSMAAEDKSVWQESASVAMAKYKEDVEQWKFQVELQMHDVPAPSPSKFPNSSDPETLFVYDSRDKTFSPICRDCYLKSPGSNYRSSS